MAGHSGGGGGGRQDGGWSNTGSAANDSVENTGNRGGETETSSADSDDGNASVDQKGDGIEKNTTNPEDKKSKSLLDDDRNADGDNNKGSLDEKDNGGNRNAKPEKPVENDDNQASNTDNRPDDKVGDIHIPADAKIVKNTVKRRRAEDIPDVLHPTREQQKTAKDLGVDPKWIKPDGKIDWPDDDGFGAISWRMTLKPGTRFDRYGGRLNKRTGELDDTGKYTSPPEVPFPDRGLPLDSEKGHFVEYEIIRPIPNVRVGAAAPWFDQPGGGLQYELPMGIQDLLDKKLIRRIEIRHEPD